MINYVMFLPVEKCNHTRRSFLSVLLLTLLDTLCARWHSLLPFKHIINHCGSVFWLVSRCRHLINHQHRSTLRAKGLWTKHNHLWDRDQWDCWPLTGPPTFRTLILHSVLKDKLLGGFVFLLTLTSQEMRSFSCRTLLIANYWAISTQMWVVINLSISEVDAVAGRQNVTASPACSRLPRISSDYFNCGKSAVFLKNIVMFDRQGNSGNNENKKKKFFFMSKIKGKLTERYSNKTCFVVLN